MPTSVQQQRVTNFGVVGDPVWMNTIFTIHSYFGAAQRNVYSIMRVYNYSCDEL